VSQPVVCCLTILVWFTVNFIVLIITVNLETGVKMSAESVNYIQKFLHKYPVTNVSLGTTLIQNTGKTTSALYEIPRPENVKKIQEFCESLVQFEARALAIRVDTVATQKLLDKITRLMEELELTAIRPKESGVDRDWIVFVPLIKDLKTPVKIPAVFVYRFGFIADTPRNDPRATVGNLALISEHSIADGAERLTADVFLTCKAKFILANLFRPHAVPNDGTFDPKIKYLTDPTHSNTTIFLPMLQTLLQQEFPEIPVLIMHGMGASLGNEYQVLIGNCFGKFREDGKRSFANMLGISFGIEDFFTSAANRAANIPSPVVSVCSKIPNFILKGGVKVPMSSDKGNGTNGALRWPGTTITTNVDGHIGYFATNPLTSIIRKDYSCSDRMIHVETTGYIRTNDIEVSPRRLQFAAIIKRAMNWYRCYDPAIHDPHRLNERFIERANNMKLYPELFNPAVIARYKKNKADIYLKDTAEYKAEFAKGRELPPPLTAIYEFPQSLLFRDFSIVSINDADESINNENLNQNRLTFKP
jgi:hypothetical protein